MGHEDSIFYFNFHSTQSTLFTLQFESNEVQLTLGIQEMVIWTWTWYLRLLNTNIHNSLFANYEKKGFSL